MFNGLLGITVVSLYLSHHFMLRLWTVVAVANNIQIRVVFITDCLKLCHKMYMIFFKCTKCTILDNTRWKLALKMMFCFKIRIYFTCVIIQRLVRLARNQVVCLLIKKPCVYLFLVEQQMRYHGSDRHLEKNISSILSLFWRLKQCFIFAKRYCTSVFHRRSLDTFYWNSDSQSDVLWSLSLTDLK